MTNEIPPMVHPHGKHWEQPDRSEILVDDECAMMGLPALEKLHDYSCSEPTGAYNGKMWKRSDWNGWWVLCWYHDENGESILVSSRPIVLVSPYSKKRSA